MKNFWHLMKDPIESVEDGNKRIRLYRTIALVSAALFILEVTLSVILNHDFSMVIRYISVIVCIFFLFYLAVAKSATKKMMVLMCDCGAKLEYNDSVEIEHISDRTGTSGNSVCNYVTLEISVDCPKCGKTKVFRKEFRDVAVRGTNAYNISSNSRSYADLVKGYFGNEIQL